MKLLHKIILPQDSVNDEEVQIVSLPFKNGEFARQGQCILEYETSKAVLGIELDRDGYIAYRCKEGDTVKIGVVVAEVFDKWDAEQAVALRSLSESGTHEQKPATMPATSNMTTIYSVRAEALIREHDVDKNLFAGRDFVSAEDVEQQLTRARSSSPRAVHKASTNHPAPTAKRTSQRTTQATGRERIVVVCANQVAAEVILDILSDQEDKVIVGYVVDEQFRSQANLDYLDTGVFDFPERVDRDSYDSVILAMGGSLNSMRFRKKVFDHYQSRNVPFTNIISSSANIAQNVSLGVGNIIEAGVYIGTCSSVGDNNFISYATIIGHHNVVGSNNLFAPGVTMAGLVEIGDDCILPTGVNFIDRVKIGNRVILPVGYNVIEELKDDTIVKMKSAK